MSTRRTLRRTTGQTLGQRHRSRRFASLAAAVVIVVAAAGCGASSDGGGTSAAGTTAAAPGAGTAAGDTAPTTVTTAAPTTTVDPGTLPQTKDKPTAASPQWELDTRTLWHAIVTGDPSGAMGFFFPLTAYRQVKNIQDPDHDYQTRLIADYEQDIASLHKQLGADAATAELVGVAVLGNGAQWIAPGVEYNKGSYWRVEGSSLVYQVRGERHTINIASMISWRGEWYVVHLSSIR
jgi:hypothetical protein